MIQKQSSPPAAALQLSDMEDVSETRQTSDMDSMEFYDYELPESSIAQTPLEPRDAARLLVPRSGELLHRLVRDLPELLLPGDLLVLNETKVFPARLRLFKPTGGSVEVLLLEPLQMLDAQAGGIDTGGRWSALVRRSRRVRPGTLLLDEDGEPVIQVGHRLGGQEEARREVVVLNEDRAMRAGTLALPPYIEKPLETPERYQTVYARVPGSVAAPTAGLHLTEELLGRCRDAGIEVAKVDLAVGIGTFQPVRVARASEHVVHEERYCVPEATWRACTSRREGRVRGRVVAVGTTVVRALESAAASGRLSARSRLTIRPPFQFRVVDLLLTNFHLPRSSLLMLICAFYGPGWKQLYQQALAEGYRFLSFGDAMLLECQGIRPPHGTRSSECATL